MDGDDPPLQYGHLRGGQPIVKPIHKRVGLRFLAGVRMVEGGDERRENQAAAQGLETAAAATSTTEFRQRHTGISTARINIKDLQLESYL
jgi:hypothetical protein